MDTARLQRNLAKKARAVRQLGPKGLVLEAGLRMGLGHNRQVEQEMFGTTYIVDRRSVRDEGPGQVDMDDGWTYALIRESRVYLDVGCNVGQFALLACAQDPDRQVACIDANPLALAVTAGNLIRNGFANRTHFAAGFVSDAPGQEVTFFTFGTLQGGSSHADHAPGAQGRSMTVSTFTIDQVCAGLDFTPDLMKIDVEGAEVEALWGAEATVAAGRPRILVEMHRVASRSMLENAQLVVDWCAGNDYEPWYLTTESRLTSAEMVEARGRCHLLLLPAGSEYPTCLVGIAQRTSVSEVEARATQRSRR